jgi:peptidyl-prolyl cis-trans isomerase C
VRNLLRNAPKGQTLTADQQSQVVDDLVNLAVMAQQGEKDGAVNDPEAQAQLALLRMRVVADAESQRFIKSLTPSDADLHAEYEQAVAKMDKNEYHAQHILVKDKADAEQIIKKLKGGAKFEDVAKASSIDSGSKNNGGDLGWFTTSRMVPPFAEAVKNLKKGEVTSEPVQTQYGWHVIKLIDTRDAAPPAFDNPQVNQQLKDAVMRKKLQAYLEDLRKQAKIEKKMDAVAETPVTPPAAGSGAPSAPAQPAAPASAPAGGQSTQ